MDNLTPKKPDKKPATPLMKRVAARTLNEKNMKKVFTQEEISEIMSKKSAGEKLTVEESTAIRAHYRKMKKRVKELEKGNQSRLIVVPSISQGDQFYKVFDFSALYYVYRLADRMGRNARLSNDDDHTSKMLHSASLVDVEKFIRQFKMFEGSDRIEKTEEGIYICYLKRPLTDDEVGQLRMVEETRRKQLQDMIRPKAMDPAVFQAILMVVRQTAPRVRKLTKQYYYAIGEGMLKDLSKMLARYFDYTNGVAAREVVGQEIMMLVDELFAGLAILSETRVWEYGVAAAIGENINELRRLVMEDFKIKDK